MSGRFDVELTPSDMAHASAYAKELGVTSSIHSKDFIFQFLITNPVFRERKEALRYYFFDGQNSAKTLGALIKGLGFRQDTKFSILEFASGYGCVTRHLQNSLPTAHLTSSDIHPEAIAFLSTKIGAHAVLSSKIPETLEIKDLYNVVFALSFFSHMPRPTWLRWLLALYARVTPGGYLIFTTHGRVSAEKHMGQPTVPVDGFWFKSDSEQKDLDVNEYGLTITLRKFVDGLERYIPGGTFVDFREAYWWGHQDLWVIRKNAAGALSDRVENLK